MQADGGLVENVEHVDELGAYLGGQTNALALAAGEAGRGAGEREVVESDLQEEVEPGAYLLEDFGRNLQLLAAEQGGGAGGDTVEPEAELGEVHAGELGNVLVGEAVGEGFAVEALAVTLGTGAVGQELVGPLLGGAGVVVLDDGAQVLDDAVEGDEVVGRGMDKLLVDAHVLQRAIENLSQTLLGEFSDGRLERAVVTVQNGVNVPENHLRAILAEGYDGPVVDGERAVGYDLGEVYLADHAEALAAGAGPLGRVEGEEVGCGVVIGNAGGGAHEAAREELALAGGMVHDEDEAVALLHGRVDRLLEAVAGLGEGLLGQGETVDDDLDVVVLVAIDLEVRHDFAQLTVDARVEVTLMAKALEEFAVVALAAAHDGGQQEEPAAPVVAENHLDDALLGIFDHGLAGHVAVGTAGAGVEQAQEVVDLGGGAYGGAGVAVGRLLLDGDDGREPGNLVNVRTLEASEKVAGVG